MLSASISRSTSTSSRSSSSARSDMSAARTPNAFENEPDRWHRRFPHTSDDAGSASVLRIAITLTSRIGRALTTTNFRPAPYFCPARRRRRAASPNSRLTTSAAFLRDSGHRLIRTDYIVQFWVGRRKPRQAEVVNKPANVDSVTLSDTTITLAVPSGNTFDIGRCNDNDIDQRHDAGESILRTTSYLQLHGFGRTYHRNRCKCDVGPERCSARNIHDHGRCR